MPKGRIRIRLKSYDHRLIDETCQKIVDTALGQVLQLSGLFRCPQKRSLCR